MDNAKLQSPKVLHLLAHPLRWGLVRALTTSDRRVQELVDTLHEPYNLVSYHLKLLRQSGLVDLRRSDGDSRDLYYSLDMERLQEEYQNAAYAIYPGWVWMPPEPAPHRTSPCRVLFLCTHNSARSQMAEGLLRHLGGTGYWVASAGNSPRAIHPETIAVMQARGIDIRQQRSKNITTLSGQQFDEIITVCDRIREVCSTYDFCNPTIHWSIPDPASIQDPEERPQAFARAAHELERRILWFLHSH